MPALHSRGSLYDFVPNTIVAQRTCQDSLLSSIHRRRLAIFGHIWRLPETTPAHTALKLIVDTWQWNTIEATSRVATAHLDETTRRRHWTRRWQSVEYRQWRWSLDGATTHRWSSASVSEWVTNRHRVMHLLSISTYLACFTPAIFWRELPRHDVKFRWDEAKQGETLNNLKHLLTSAPMLAMPSKTFT